MDDVIVVTGHVGFTWGAYLTSNWTETGAGVLMVLQATLLIWKLIDKARGKNRRRNEQ